MSVSIVLEGNARLVADTPLGKVEYLLGPAEEDELYRAIAEQVSRFLSDVREDLEYLAKQGDRVRELARDVVSLCIDFIADAMIRVRSSVEEVCSSQGVSCPDSAYRAALYIGSDAAVIARKAIKNLRSIVSRYGSSWAIAQLPYVLLLVALEKGVHGTRVPVALVREIDDYVDQFVSREFWDSVRDISDRVYEETGIDLPPSIFVEVMDLEELVSSYMEVALLYLADMHSMDSVDTCRVVVEVPAAERIVVSNLPSSDPVDLVATLRCATGIWCEELASEMEDLFGVKSDGTYSASIATDGRKTSMVLLLNPEQFVVVDMGCGVDIERIRREVVAAGGDLDPVELMLITLGLDRQTAKVVASATQVERNECIDIGVATLCWIENDHTYLIACNDNGCLILAPQSYIGSRLLATAATIMLAEAVQNHVVPLSDLDPKVLEKVREALMSISPLAPLSLGSRMARVLNLRAALSE